MKILVSGCAGFIGMHVCERLLQRGDRVVGVDDLNDYYDPSLKQARLARLVAQGGFSFVKLNLGERQATASLFAASQPERVVHLAAQAGVRHSLHQPHSYADSNLLAFLNVLEGCRHGRVGHLVYASSSSVYGGNTTLPYREHDNVDHPLSLYAATKKANELMAHSYSHLYGLPCSGLRLFTVYGPWGRPDMAYFHFSRDILADQPIKVFNQGRMQRDFTYVDDAVEALVRVLDRPPEPDPAYDPAHPDAARSAAPYRLLNVGNRQPVDLTAFIETLEQALGKTAQKTFLPMQDGDVAATCADTTALEALTGFAPHTPLAAGLRRFVSWYLPYYGHA